jgi:tetratricopeptide (TPR) repeat protein
MLERAVAKAPGNARAHQQLGVVLLRAGRTGDAHDALRRALAAEERLPAAWNALGVALYRLQGPAAALPAWRRAVELDNGQIEALFNLGLVAASLGRRGEARHALERFVATAPPDRHAADLSRARELLRELG